MSYYSVLAITPTMEDWIPPYIGSVTALVAKHGGKYLARTASHERLEGKDGDAALRVIIEWPSKEVRQAAWEKMQEDERFHPDNILLSCRQASILLRMGAEAPGVADDDDSLMGLLLK